MTNTYASFKGKLKVGDRVRPEGQVETVTVSLIEDDGFTMKTLSGRTKKMGWDYAGTLELLSPSPRVVTLESLQPGDRIRKETNTSLSDLTCLDVSKNGKVGFFFITDKETHGLITLTIGSLIKDGYQPVQPASPPAPAEKEEEWFYNESLWWREDMNGHMQPCLSEIIAEAKRRGAEEAWKECRFLVAHTKLWSKGNVEGTRQDILARLDAKLESLNKPAGAGEK